MTQQMGISELYPLPFRCIPLGQRIPVLQKLCYYEPLTDGRSHTLGQKINKLKTTTIEIETSVFILIAMSWRVYPGILYTIINAQLPIICYVSNHCYKLCSDPVREAPQSGCSHSLISTSLLSLMNTILFASPRVDRNLPAMCKIIIAHFTCKSDSEGISNSKLISIV